MKSFIPYVRTNIELKLSIDGWEQKFEFINTRSGESEPIARYDVLYVLNQINNLNSFKVLIQTPNYNSSTQNGVKYVPVNNVEIDKERNGIIFNYINNSGVKKFKANRLYEILNQFENIDKFFTYPSEIDDNEPDGLHNYSIIIDHYNKVIAFNYLEN